MHLVRAKIWYFCVIFDVEISNTLTAIVMDTGISELHSFVSKVRRSLTYAFFGVRYFLNALRKSMPYTLPCTISAVELQNIGNNRVHGDPLFMILLRFFYNF